MPFAPRTLSEFLDVDADTVIDVRSPSEFDEDHVPGAINLPVLSDEERARVGTIYVQESPFRARKIGAALVAKNAARHIEGPLADYEGGWRPLVYCWRGGQRSGSFASILSQIGWRAETVEGGYRRWRRLVKEALYDRPLPSPVMLLDGNTGTAKTDVLGRLPTRGVQVIDLEGLANHRGSALGAMGEQPAQKAFETSLAAAIARLDPGRPVILEAESSKIGRLNLPPRVFEAMKAAPRMEISATVSARAAFLTEAYADITADCGPLIDRLEKLVPLQGRETVQTWQDMAREGRFRDLAGDLITRHYDPRYAKVRERIGGRIVEVVEARDLDEVGREDLADRIADAIIRRAG